ncbi:hypothetical protein [Saccharopolyspora shandongensis]|uniref:hypothetical protein n=1 Tax=Saccharopolyspora shandongensis TaxID=418495 RepID=UPI00340F76F3
MVSVLLRLETDLPASPEHQLDSADEHGSVPADLARQRLRLWTLTDIVFAVGELLDDEEAQVRCPELAKQHRVVAQQLEDAMSLLSTAEDYGGLDVERGATLEDVREAVAQRHAAEVDADLERRDRPADPDEVAWTVQYDYRNGTVTATSVESDPHRRRPDTLRGFAPTPVAAADLVASWHGDTIPPVRFEFPPASKPSLLVPYREAPKLSIPYPDPVTLLDQGGACYQELLVACARIRRHLRTVPDLDDWIRQRTALLNRQTPHLPNHGLGTLVTPAHGHKLGFIDVLEWVQPERVLSTYSDAWGEFGGHREHSLRDVVEGLASAESIEKFVRELFGVDAIDLNRIPGWAGPVYQLGNDGCHRIHAARVLGLPWIAAQVGYSQHASEWQLSELTIENGRIFPGKLREYRLALIQGLDRRGIIDVEVIPTPDPLWTRVRCTRLPAPWLLRAPEWATRVNAAYERAIPGALGQLGIPVGIGTQRDKWTAWLTTDGEPRELLDEPRP